VFPTARVRTQALAEDLVAAARSSVVLPGLEDPGAAVTAGAEPPPGVTRLIEQDEMMLLMADGGPEEHRVFALRLLEQLQRRHGWKGAPALAGRRAPEIGGWAAEEEAKLLSEHAPLRAAVLELGEVSEPQHRWLLARASLLLHPFADDERWETLPWQAARRGVPCLLAPGFPLGALTPSIAEIIPWDPAESADRAFSLLTEPKRAKPTSPRFAWWHRD